jgi:hypothetical protein
MQAGDLEICGSSSSCAGSAGLAHSSDQEHQTDQRHQQVQEQYAQEPDEGIAPEAREVVQPWIAAARNAHKAESTWFIGQRIV